MLPGARERAALNADGPELLHLAHLAQGHGEQVDSVKYQGGLRLGQINRWVYSI